MKQIFSLLLIVFYCTFVKAEKFIERVPVYGVIKPGEISTLLAINNGMVAQIPNQVGAKVKVGQIIIYVIEKETSRAYRSTINGVVAKTHVTKGAAVTPGMPMITVLDPQKKVVEVSLSPDEAARVGVGSKIFYQGTENKFGEIKLLSPLVDPDTGGVLSVVRPDKNFNKLIGDIIPLSLAVREISDCKIVDLNQVNKYSSNYRVIATTGTQACLRRMKAVD